MSAWTTASEVAPPSEYDRRLKRVLAAATFACPGQPQLRRDGIIHMAAEFAFDGVLDVDPLCAG